VGAKPQAAALSQRRSGYRAAVSAAPQSPEFSIAIELTASSEATEISMALPRRPGVFALENPDGQTIAIATTADLRRAVTAKVASIQPVADVRRVRAEPVGSAFEADWVYLHQARRRFPQSYRSLLDRWQAWFVQCDTAATHPQFTKTAHPSPADSQPTTVFLGPFPDKHSAGRHIELVQDAFDLCRYHHILVQAPHGTACAYKEMGRCPAPCDGTVSMASYHRQISQAIEYACTPIKRWRDSLERSMHAASARLDFELAHRCRVLLQRTQPAERAEFALVDRLERFRFVAVMKSRRRRFARLFLILGGSIEPIAELPIGADAAAVEELLHQVRTRAAAGAADFTNDGIENIGMICRHLFRPRRTKAAGGFLRINDELTVAPLASAISRLGDSTNDESADAPEVADQVIDEPAGR
jgi:excinuclease UvrABC nuclease subunit